MLKVQAAVEEVFDSLSPRDDITLEQFSKLTLEVRKKIEGATEEDRQSTRWLQYLLPPRDQELAVLRESGVLAESTLPHSAVSLSLRRLLDETSDLIDSPPFSHVLTLLLDASFSLLVDQKISQQSFKLPPGPESGERIQEIVEPQPVKLPIVLATLTRQAHKIGNGVPNEYLQAMEEVRDLEAFAAVVYSSNWETEIAPIRDGSDTKEKQPSGESSIVDDGTASTFEGVWSSVTQRG
jgi:peroxin-3